MSRNRDRLNLNDMSAEPAEAPAKLFDPLSFVAPTEFVDLPSKGLGYPKDHPLYKQESIEIRFMTAKDEDVLSNQSYIRKGIATERLLENIIINKKINPITMLVADRNAVLIQARGTAYGFDYEAIVSCPKCQTKNRMEFDLRTPKIEGGWKVEQDIVTMTEEGYFKTKMPYSKFEIVFKPANGEQEAALTEAIVNQKDSFDLVEQYKKMIISIEGYSQKEVIERYVDNMPIYDADHLKICLGYCTPSIRVTEKLTCKSCSHEEEVDVPMGTDFFWPKLKIHGSGV